MKLSYKVFPGGNFEGYAVPASLAYVDIKEVRRCKITMLAACKAIAAAYDGPVAINIFDLDACTTNSDGVMIDGAMLCIAAGDYGKIDPTYGYVEMAEITMTEELLREEPHLRQWLINFPKRKLYLGPNPYTKPLPVHNAVSTGRLSSNNSGSELMDCVTMDEMLFPITGQLEVFKDGEIEFGLTGYTMTVGIGFIVPEEFGRIVPHRQFACGDTSHQAGKYTKYLKSDIAAVAADKRTLAQYIIKAIRAGMVPGRDIAPSPAVLAVAKHMGATPDYDNMTAGAFFELSDVGLDQEWLDRKVLVLSDEEIIEKARKIIPGHEDSKYYKVSDVIHAASVEV